jgi:hypothetical protein
MLSILKPPLENPSFGLLGERIEGNNVNPLQSESRGLERLMFGAKRSFTAHHHGEVMPASFFIEG